MAGKYPLLLATSIVMPGNIAGVLDMYMSGLTHVVEDYSSLTQLTLNTDGIWLSSSFATTRELETGALVKVPWPEGKEPTPVNVSFYRVARHRLSPAASWLKRAMQAHIEELNRHHSTGPGSNRASVELPST